MPGIIMLVALDFETHGILARPKLVLDEFDP